jgi:hypothetical protein
MTASFTHTIEDSASAHPGRGKQVTEYIHPREHFSGGASEVDINSSLFIELLLASLTAEQAQEIMVWAGMA